MKTTLLPYHIRRITREIFAGLFVLLRATLALAAGLLALPCLLVAVLAGVLLCVFVVAAAVCAPIAKKPKPEPLGGRLDATILQPEARPC